MKLCVETLMYGPCQIRDNVFTYFLFYLFANFHFPDMVINDVERECRSDTNDGCSEVVNGAIHRSRHDSLADQVAASLGHAVLCHRRQRRVRRRPKVITISLKKI